MNHKRIWLGLIVIFILFSLPILAKDRIKLSAIDKWDDFSTRPVIASKDSMEQALYNTLFSLGITWDGLTREERRLILERSLAMNGSGLGLRVDIQKMEKLRKVQFEIIPIDNGQDQYVIIRTNLLPQEKGWKAGKVDQGLYWIFRKDGPHLGVRFYTDPPQDKLDLIAEELEKDPENSEMWLAKAILYDFSDPRTALEEYQRTIEHFPDFAAAHNNLAMLYTGYSNLNLQDPEKALYHAKKACELTNQENLGHLDTLARAYFVNGDYEEALELIRSIMEKSDDFAYKNFLEILECNQPEREA